MNIKNNRKPDMFQEGSLNEITTVTNDYIDFCVQLVFPTKEIKIYPNNKSYART